MLDDTKVHVKTKLSALWASVIGPTRQGSLLAAALMLAAPGLVVFLSIALPPAVSRWLNILPGVFFSLIVAATLPGAWNFYIAFGIIDIALTSLIAWLAWRWPRIPVAGTA